MSAAYKNMPGQTGLTQRRQKYQRNSELARAGICIACESEPCTTNQDGSQSIRCAQCKAKQPPKNRVRKLNSANAVKPKRPVGEWGMDEDHGFIDQPHFREMCVRVAKVIRDGACRTRSIKTAMGDELNERMLADILESLISAGEITERQCGAMQRYEHCVTRRIATMLQFNKTPAPPADRTIPWGHLEDNRHRVTA